MTKTKQMCKKKKARPSCYFLPFAPCHGHTPPSLTPHHPQLASGYCSANPAWRQSVWSVWGAKSGGFSPMRGLEPRYAVHPSTFYTDRLRDNHANHLHHIGCDLSHTEDRESAKQSSDQSEISRLYICSGTQNVWFVYGLCVAPFSACFALFSGHVASSSACFALF